MLHNEFLRETDFFNATDPGLYANAQGPTTISA
jgi:hypothetical protein